MEHFPISRTDTGLHIEGFPDAVKVVRLNGLKAKRLADLALHKADLECAVQCLESINQVGDRPWVVQQALWRSAIVHMMKCFGDSGARSQLSAKKIYKGDSLALTVFDYFKNLRNKHFIHDENSYAQSLPGAVLNKGNKPFKIEKIICVNTVAETLEQENYSNLQLLIEKARDWVDKEFEALCEALTKELEAEPYENLFKREAISFNVPTVNEIDKNRKTP